MTPSVEILREGRPFDEAVEFFRRKVDLPTETWRDLWADMHARGFVVAGAMRTDMLADFREAVDKAVAQGATLEDFRKDFDRIVRRYGWSYRGSRGWRTAVIMNTNCRTAYQAGHYRQMTDPRVAERRPFWRYLAVLDSRTRPQHAAWHNTVLRWDDPWWKTHYPPNGWGCRCTVVSHAPKDLDRLEAEGEELRQEAPPIEWVDWTDKKTGVTRRIPRGIDPGWDYNVGEAAWGRTRALRLMEDTGPWEPLDDRGPADFGLPERLPLDKPKARPSDPVPVGEVEALRSALRSALGADEAHLVDPSGEVVLAGQAIVDHILEKPETRWDGRERYFPLIPELIEDPAEIWVSFARSALSGRVALRRRYIKFVQLRKKKVLGAWAEVQDGLWVAGDFFRGDWSGSKRLRVGRPVYARNER